MLIRTLLILTLGFLLVLPGATILDVPSAAGAEQAGLSATHHPHSGFPRARYFPFVSVAGEPVAPDWVAQCAADTVPFESQAWWAPDFGHVHAGFCAPQGQTISGKYTFKVRLILHNNPGLLERLQAQIDDSRYGAGVPVKVSCPITDTCAWDREVTVDTATFPYDGWHQIRIRATVKEPDGKELITSSYVPVYFNNGHPVVNFEKVLLGGTVDYLAGRGWYTDANYVWSVAFDPRRAGERVSGIYKVKLRSMATDTPQPVSRFIVKLDGTHTAPGTVLYDVPNRPSAATELDIDTTRLANGWHSLLARTEAANNLGSNCPLCSGLPQTHAGVSKVWFYVQNP